MTKGWFAIVAVLLAVGILAYTLRLASVEPNRPTRGGFIRNFSTSAPSSEAKGYICYFANISVYENESVAHVNCIFPLDALHESLPSKITVVLEISEDQSNWRNISSMHSVPARISKGWQIEVNLNAIKDYARQDFTVRARLLGVYHPEIISDGIPITECF